MFATSPDGVKIADKTQPPAQISTVAAMLAAETREVDFAPIADDPQALTSSSRLRLLSVLSDEWQDASGAWATATKNYLSQTNNIVQSVQVAPSSAVLATADQIAVPVTVSNHLGQNVTVTLAVRTLTPLVTVDKDSKSQVITIDANSQRRVLIPIQALSNGKARLRGYPHLGHRGSDREYRHDHGQRAGGLGDLRHAGLRRAHRRPLRLRHRAEHPQTAQGAHCRCER